MSKCIVFLLILLYSIECKDIILRGKRIDDGQFPWLVQFQTIVPCGGVLISSDWVLTAAQCMQDKRNSIVLHAAGLNEIGSRQVLNVKAVYIFPQYEAYTVIPDRDYNIALIKLVQPLDICNLTFPDIIPLKLDYNHFKNCFIFGWESQVSRFGKVLAKPIQYSEVILNSWRTCSFMLKDKLNYTNVFCAMAKCKDGIKACAGNPGSPIICEDPYHRIILLGIATWTNFSLSCNNYPIYLNISTFRTWIYDIIFNGQRIEEWKSNLQQYTRNNNVIINQRDNIDSGNVYQPNASLRHEKSSSQKEYYYQHYSNISNNNDSNMKFQGKPTKHSYYEANQINEKWNHITKLKLNNSAVLDENLTEDDKNQMEAIDDFELIFPFGLDDAHRSCMKFIPHFKLLLLFYSLLLYLFENIFFL